MLLPKNCAYCQILLLSLMFLFCALQVQGGLGLSDESWTQILHLTKVPRTNFCQLA